MIRIKNKQQIDKIRVSCKYLARLLQELRAMTVDGVTTADIDMYAREYMKKIGGKPAWVQEGFPGAVCASVNEEVIHGIPSKKKIIRSGDLVSLDVGINLDGYISDATITVPVGNVKPEYLEMLACAQRALDAGIAACVAGNRIGAVSRAVYDIASQKYGVVYQYCGHGVGLKVHEDPSIPNVPDHGANHRIVPGMVLAIEPMINYGTADVEVLDDDWTVVTADNSVSVHVEHTVAVFDGHTEILTQLQDGEELPPLA